MALMIIGKTECALCRAVIEENEKIVATSHFIADPKDRLWRFSDAAMHKRCFSEWDQRQVFVERYNEIVGNITWGNGTYHHMNDEGTIISIIREHLVDD